MKKSLLHLLRGLMIVGKSNSDARLMNVNTPYDYERCLKNAAEQKETKRKSSTKK